MNITIERLISLEAFSSCERLQQEVGKYEESQILPTYLLVTLHRSGGTVLGAYDTDVKPPRLCGCLIDLVAHYDGRPSWITLFHGVVRELRNCGIGYQLRVKEREECQKRDVGLITWALDPLRSLEAHFSFNKLGAICVGYERNLYGELPDPANRGLASDRLMVEWWIDSPRVTGVVDRGVLPYHFHLGLDRMEVVTKTKLVENGMRRLVGFEAAAGSDVILVEIPVNLDRIRALNPALARDWRIKMRDVFEQVLARGYIITGFVHEADRSFHLLERTKKGAVLGRAS